MKIQMIKLECFNFIWRLCCGANRGFIIYVMDNSKNVFDKKCLKFKDKLFYHIFKFI